MQRRYYIEQVKYGITKDMGYGGEEKNISIKYICDREPFWLTLNEWQGIPTFYVTQINIFEKLMNHVMYDEVCFRKYLEDSKIDEFDGIDIGNYEIIINSMKWRPETSSIDLLDYIIDFSTHMDDADEYVRAAVNRYADQINDIICDEEELYIEELSNEELFMHRLYLESEIKYEKSRAKIDYDVLKQLYKVLRSITAVCPKGYEVWKRDYIETELNTLKGQNIVTIPYHFWGDYRNTATVLESCVKEFKMCLIKQGRVSFYKPIPATRSEIETFIGLRIFTVA